MNYIEVKQTVGLLLSSENKDKWFKLTNKFYHGEELVPFDVKVTQEHKDAHWHVNVPRNVELTIRLYEDGSLLITPVESYQPFKPL